MTLPTTTILPLHSEKIQAGGKELDAYLRELVFSLQGQYEELAQAINGDIRSNTEQGSRKYTPVLEGSTSGTFSYVHQVGWVVRKGIMVDVWGDVEWDDPGTAAGDLFLKLPYKVANSSQIPFVGVVQPSGITYTSGTELEINAEPNTYNAFFYNSGNGITTGKQQVVSSGRLIFHIRYVGQGLER